MGDNRLVFTDSEWLLEQGTRLGGQIPHSQGELVREALEELEPRHRDLLLMYFYERLTYEQIAQETGRTGRAYSFYDVARALEALRVKLQEKGVTYEDE